MVLAEIRRVGTPARHAPQDLAERIVQSRSRPRPHLRSSHPQPRLDIQLAHQRLLKLVRTALAFQTGQPTALTFGHLHRPALSSAQKSEQLAVRIRHVRYTSFVWTRLVVTTTSLQVRQSRMYLFAASDSSINTTTVTLCFVPLRNAMLTIALRLYLAGLRAIAPRDGKEHGVRPTWTNVQCSLSHVMAMAIVKMKLDHIRVSHAHLD
mmetsp:Transcript_27293/g.81781  ORF Transcript_27293/g.81781 Transcript_27293/m.81781 type:complete len:208 (+) Transcript_27293:2576-3199(+)